MIKHRPKRREPSAIIPSKAPPERRQPDRSRSRTWVAVVAALALGAVGYFVLRDDGLHQASPTAEWHIPDPDLTDMLPPVARSIQTAREGVVKQPSSAEAWGRFGNVLDAHHLYSDAAICYGRAHDLAPGAFQWAYMLAVVRDLLGADQKQIVEAFEKAIKLNSVYPPAFFRYGQALLRQGMLTEARDAYQTAVELDPKFAMAHHGLGQSLLSMGEAESAVKHLAQARELDPTDSMAYTALARAYQLTGDRGRAKEAADKAGSLKPSLSVPDPVRFDMQLLAVDPRSCIRRYAGNMRAGRFDKAISDLKLLLEMFPGTANYHVELATCYQKVGDKDAAIGHLTKAIELDENLTDARIRLAGLLDQKGATKKAEQQYRLASAQQPGNAAYHAKLGFFLANHGKLAGAVSEFERAAVAIGGQGLGPEHPDVATSLNNLALLYYSQGRYAEAEPLFQRALAIWTRALGPEHPDVATSLEHYAILLRETNRGVEAARLAARAKAIREKAAK